MGELRAPAIYEMMAEIEPIKNGMPPDPGGRIQGYVDSSQEYMRTKYGTAPAQESSIASLVTHRTPGLTH